MLRTNSKQARENIRQYITENFTPENYTEENIQGFENIAKFILDVFKEEYGNLILRYNTQQEAFKDWCSGLPSVLDTCYYYNRSAVEDVKNILEETDAEANKYTEQQAEELLTSLIYRELMKASMR